MALLSFDNLLLLVMLKNSPSLLKYLLAKGPIDPKSSKVNGSSVMFSSFISCIIDSPGVVIPSSSVVDGLLYLSISPLR